MFDGSYRKRLESDLPKWREAGWVTPAGAEAILAAAGERRGAFGMAAIVGTLGALLLGLGVIAFIGANWDYMPRLMRLAILAIGLALAFLAAARFAQKGYRVFSEAALLVAGLVFGASIALIGQTYHLAGDFSGALLLWEIGILGAALLTGSSVLAMLAMIGGGYWTWLVTVENGMVPHWGGLAVILIGGAIATVLDARYARIVAVLAFIFWIILTVGTYADAFDWSFAGTFALGAALALVVWSLGTALGTFSGKAAEGLGHAMLWPGLAAILLTLGLLQTAAYWTDSGTGQQWLLPAVIALVVAVLLVGYAFTRKIASALDVLAIAGLGLAAIAFALWETDGDLLPRLAGGVIVLAAALWAINSGDSGVGHVGKTTGLAAFGIEIIYLYVVTLGTQLDTALAFLVGGVLFIAIAWGLFKLDRRMAAGRATP